VFFLRGLIGQYVNGVVAARCSSGPCWPCGRERRTPALRPARPLASDADYGLLTAAALEMRDCQPHWGYESDLDRKAELLQEQIAAPPAKIVCGVGRATLPGVGVRVGMFSVESTSTSSS
jgi:hypothetical protein